MTNKQIVERIISNIGNKPNITAIRKSPGEICILVDNKKLLDVEKLEQLVTLHIVKKFKIVDNKLLLYLPKKELTELFEAFKELPQAKTRIRKRDEIDEDNNDIPLVDRFKNLLLKDLIPLVIGFGFFAYLLGLINFLGSILG